MLTFVYTALPLAASSLLNHQHLELRLSSKYHVSDLLRITCLLHRREEDSFTAASCFKLSVQDDFGLALGQTSPAASSESEHSTTSDMTPVADEHSGELVDESVDSSAGETIKETSHETQGATPYNEDDYEADDEATEAENTVECAGGCYKTVDWICNNGIP